MIQTTTDFLIVGGGVIGLNLALQARRRYPDARVTLIEKEAGCGMHASGRNSGVLHAGFYYSADSLKAKFCRDGNRALTQYCEARGIPLNLCGKLVVAKNAEELATLRLLLERGRANGVEVHELDLKQAQEIEPRVKTFERALFSPTTSSVDPKAVMAALLSDARGTGVDILTGTTYLGRKGAVVRTNCGRITAGYVINAAGLYADKIARDYGFSHDFRIIPFKGLYLYCNQPPGTLRSHIYPVPDLRNPFLGVHFTVTAQGTAKLGPTAIPALWREHYCGLENFKAAEMMEIMLRETGLLLRNDFDFRRLAREELAKYSKVHMVKLAAELATGVQPAHYTRWGAPGIRAQLFDLKKRKLEMDFRYEGDAQSFHVLNAVSPAFTCAMPFTAYLFDHIDALIERRQVSTYATQAVASA